VSLDRNIIVQCLRATCRISLFYKCMIYYYKSCTGMFFWFSCSILSTCVVFSAELGLLFAQKWINTHQQITGKKH